LARKQRYELDLSDLQYKLVRLPWKTRLNRFISGFAISLAVAAFYIYIFTSNFGSPKEQLLNNQLENMKLQYSLLSMQMSNAEASLNSYRLSDEKRFRPILDMESVPESFWKGGTGGVVKYNELKGLGNSDFLISYKLRMEQIRNMANVQSDSYKALAEKSAEWKRQVENFPGISPVSVHFRLGDKYAFRTIHPVLGTPRMHNGQDFKVPYGTEVYATGNGVVVESGYSTGGFGNYIVIDHDYGLQTLYGHLSEIKVSRGTEVKRGELIGKSGDSGLSSGPHLHYQVEERGRAINPLNYLNNDMTLEEYTEMIEAFGSKTSYR
jgi:murein DD-endopeptidase MepM/ murein hydrolase activator NlpD